MVYGYARVSTSDRQVTDLQVDALNAAGCEEVFEDHISGIKDERPCLTGLLNVLTRGDTVIVWKLDRLGRSVPHLLKLIEEFKKKAYILNRLRKQSILNRHPAHFWSPCFVPFVAWSAKF